MGELAEPIDSINCGGVSEKATTTRIACRVLSSLSPITSFEEFVDKVLTLRTTCTKIQKYIQKIIAAWNPPNDQTGSKQYEYFWNWQPYINQKIVN